MARKRKVSHFLKTLIIDSDNNDRGYAVAVGSARPSSSERTGDRRDHSIKVDNR